VQTGVRRFTAYSIRETGVAGESGAPGYRQTLSGFSYELVEHLSHESRVPACRYRETVLR
jgi:hypothetical protein